MKKFITLSLVLIYITTNLSLLGMYTYNSPTKFLSDKNYVTLSKEEYQNSYDRLLNSNVNLSIYQLGGTKGRFYYTNNICEFSKDYISDCHKPSLHNEINDKIDTRMMSYTIENMSNFTPHTDNINIFFDNKYTQNQVDNYINLLELSKKNIQKDARPFDTHNVFVKEYVLMLMAIIMLLIYLLFSLLNKNRKYISIMLLEGYDMIEIIWTLNKTIIITFFCIIPFIAFLFQLSYFDFWDIDLLFYYLTSLIFTIFIFIFIWVVLSSLFVKRNIIFFLKGHDYNKFFQIYMVAIKSIIFIFMVSLVVIFFFNIFKYNHLIKYEELEKKISSDDFKDITTPVYLVPENDNINLYTVPIDGKIIKIKDNQQTPFLYTNNDFFESRTLINDPIKVFPNYITNVNSGLIGPLSQGNFMIFGDGDKIQNLLTNLKIDRNVQITSIDYQYNHNLDLIIKNHKTTLYKLISATIIFIIIMIYLIIFQFKIQIKKISIFTLEGYSKIKKYEDIIIFSIISYAVFYLLSINNIRIHFQVIKISLATTISLLLIELIILLFVDKFILNNKIKDYLKGRDG